MKKPNANILMTVLGLLWCSELFSQEFSKEYLQSLPPEIQADVLKNIAQEADTKAELYRGQKQLCFNLILHFNRLSFN